MLTSYFLYLSVVVFLNVEDLKAVAIWTDYSSDPLTTLVQTSCHFQLYVLGFQTLARVAHVIPVFSVATERGFSLSYV